MNKKHSNIRPSEQERACKVCGATFIAKRADLARGWGECCSKSCSAVLRGRKTATQWNQFNSRSFTNPYTDRELKEMMTNDVDVMPYLQTLITGLGTPKMSE